MTSSSSSSPSPRRGATVASLCGLALVSVLLLCGAGNVPIENFTPQGAMQADLNAGGHNITNATTVAAAALNATNVTVSGTLTATNFTLPYANVTATPTNIAGYGITDAYTKTQSDGRYDTNGAAAAAQAASQPLNSNLTAYAANPTVSASSVPVSGLTGTGSGVGAALAQATNTANGLVTQTSADGRYLAPTGSGAHLTALNGYTSETLAAASSSLLTDLGRVSEDTLTLNAGTAPYTVNRSLVDAGAQAGDVWEINVSYPASTNPTLNIYDNSTGGTLLVTSAGTTIAGTTTLQFVFNGTNWVHYAKGAILTKNVASFQGTTSTTFAAGNDSRFPASITGPRYGNGSSPDTAETTAQAQSSTIGSAFGTGLAAAMANAVNASGGLLTFSLLGNANTFANLQTVTVGTGTPTVYGNVNDLVLNDLITTDASVPTNLEIVGNITPPDATFGQYIGMNAVAFPAGTFNETGATITGVRSTSTYRGSGGWNEIDAYDTHVGNQSFENSGTGATVANVVGFHAQAPIIAYAADAITNYYGLKIEPIATTGITNAYGVFQEGTNDTNIFDGFVSVHNALQVYGGETITSGNLVISAGNETMAAASPYIKMTPTAGGSATLGADSAGNTSGPEMHLQDTSNNNYYEYIQSALLTDSTFGPARASFANVRTMDIYGNQVNSGSVTGAGLVTSNGQLSSTGSSPSIAAGAGAGSTGTATLAGNNLCGVVTITVSGTPATGTIATLTLASSVTFTHQAVMTLMPGNSTAAGNAAPSNPYVTGTATTAVINSGTTALPVGTYVYNYHLMGY